jgi:hypothetical protein
MENFSLLRNAVLRTLPVALADYIKAADTEERKAVAVRVYHTLPSLGRQEVVNLLEREQA